MNPTHVRFAELRQFLLDLGFNEQEMENGHFRFRHARSDTIFHFRPYKPDDFVIEVHYRMVRRILDERGLMNADEFDRLLSKTPA
jgi:hypothetical protein